MPELEIAGGCSREGGVGFGSCTRGGRRQKDTEDLEGDIKAAVRWYKMEKAGRTNGCEWKMLQTKFRRA